jgi:hypothetical protein
MPFVNRIHEDELGWSARTRTYRGVPFTGVGFRLYPDGATMFEIPYRDGRADGLMQQWDAEGRLTCDRLLGESLLQKIERDDPAYGWLVELAEHALARLPQKYIPSIPPPGTETTEYRYDSDDNLVYRLEYD